MSALKIIFIAVGVVAAIGVAYLFFTGSFVYLFYKSSYETENGKVYYHVAGIGRNELLDVDYATFKAIRRGHGFFAEDKNHIYFSGEPLKGVDRNSFEILSYRYWSRDKNAIYHGSTRLEGLDPKKFRFINENYATDGHLVFSGGHQIDGADPETFVVIKDGNLAKDKYRYYYFEEKGQLVDGQFVSDEDAKADVENK